MKFFVQYDKNNKRTIYKQNHNVTQYGKKEKRVALCFVVMSFNPDKENAFKMVALIIVYQIVISVLPWLR